MFRQGDVIITPTSSELLAPTLNHLILAEGEETGHRHQITSGKAELVELYGMLFLKVFSPTVLLTHEEHGAMEIPLGNWEIRLQREYVPPDRRYLTN
jgi:hypothetical protein